LRTDAILFLTATLAFAFASFAFLRLNLVSSLRSVVSGDLFAMIDKSMRRLTSDLYILRKLVGSRDKSTTKPPVKHVWGVITVQEMDPTSYDEESSKKAAGFPSFMFLSKQGTEIFDTTQEIKQGAYPPLNHIERECIKKGCTFHKVTHA